nr:MAG TPA: hypothetical protein [Caudoviricetes sp.]
MSTLSSTIKHPSKSIAKCLMWFLTRHFLFFGFEKIDKSFHKNLRPKHNNK